MKQKPKPKRPKAKNARFTDWTEKSVGTRLKADFVVELAWSQYGKARKA